MEKLFELTTQKLDIDNQYNIIVYDYHSVLLVEYYGTTPDSVRFYIHPYDKDFNPNTKWDEVNEQGDTYHMWLMDIVRQTVMPHLIPINDYANAHGKAFRTVRQKAKMGNFKTAKKIGRNWFIDSREPYVDSRITSGQYKDWRKVK